MSGRELFTAMLQAFFMITTGIVVSMYVFCLIINPNASFALDEIGKILLMAFVSDLPYVLFFSRKELSKKQMLIRQVLHLSALLAVLLYLAHLWNWVNLNSLKEVTIFLVLVLIVYTIIFVATAYRDKKLADKLNDKLKERYRS